MAFEFVRHNLEGRDRRIQRLFEVLPAAASWLLVLGLLALSVLAPLAAAVVMIALLTYWLLRMAYTTIFLVIGFSRISVEADTDWHERVEDLYRQADAPRLQRSNRRTRMKLRTRISLRSHRRRMREMARLGESLIPRDEIYHLVMFPIAREERAIFEASVKAVAESKYDMSKVIVVLAVEGRASDAVKADARAVADEYRDVFGDIRVIVHPDGIEGEAKVKGANLTYCTRAIIPYLDERGIDHDKVIVSTFDADTVPTAHYFSCLTYFYLVSPNRTNVSYQPIPLFTNNIWNVPAYARVLLMGSTAFQMIESTDSEMLVSFSSHSITLSVLEDVGFWPIDIITDDAGIYWKSLIHTNAEFRVVPIPIVVSMDVADSGSFFKTFVEIYRQQRRWAWGVENLATALRGLLPSKKIPVTSKIRFTVKLFDNFVTWATLPIILTGLAWMPSAIAGIFHIQQAVAMFNYGRISGTIFRLASVNLLVMMAVTLLLTLRYSGGGPLHRKLLYPLEWLLIPVITLLLNAAPAFDAMTRLALGNSLEHMVASKRLVENVPERNSRVPER